MAVLDNGEVREVVSTTCWKGYMHRSAITLKSVTGEVNNIAAGKLLDQAFNVDVT